MTPFLRRALGLLSFGLLMTLGVCRAQDPPYPSQKRQLWPVNAYLFPTVQAGSYDFCLDSSSEKPLTVRPHSSGPHAEAKNEGTLKTVRATVTTLAAPLPSPGYGPLDRIPGRSWTGLRWNTDGLPPGLYTLTVTFPISVADDTGTAFPVPDQTASLPIYLPRPDGLQAAQAEYLSRRVWMTQPLGLNSVTGHAGYQFAPQTSFRVKSITRLNQPYADLAMNGGDGPGWDVSAADFVTHTPLRVVFDQPRRVKIDAPGED